MDSDNSSKYLIKNHSAVSVRMNTLIIEDNSIDLKNNDTKILLYGQNFWKQKSKSKRAKSSQPASYLNTKVH